MIRDLLKTRILQVNFIKKNGDLRTMLCTLREDVIPKISGTSVKKDGIITVYDIESDGWRSFNEDSIIDFQDVTEEGESF